ncbi:MAG: hypothetical protein JEY96_19615 [Bacteroidales bacterium]|nr:hypothetical protein [Bacteroidales bacterium]
MKIPKPLIDLIESRKQKEISSNICENCDSHCCTGPGFAIYENIKIIYDKYQTGVLIRESLVFKRGLTFEQFIYEYFDRVAFQNGSFIAFFPKTISDRGELISVPPWNYYESRKYLQSRDGRHGCIFLKKNFSVNQNDNGCLLHHNQNTDEISAKPIDCLFLQCSPNKQQIKPTSAESSLWFSLLDFHFPDSLKKFNEEHPSMTN